MTHNKISFSVTEVENGADFFLGRYGIEPTLTGIINFYTGVMKKKLPRNPHFSGNKSDGFVICDGSETSIVCKFEPLGSDDK